MPLSEHEQRLLDQMERALYAEDPKFASSLRSSNAIRPTKKRLALGILLGVLGLALLVAGVAVKLPIVGVVGFIAMLGGAAVALTGERSEEESTPESPTTKLKKPSPKPDGGFMGKMEDRWRQRREGDGFPRNNE